ncbi:MAG: (4Fe-4S)-binding protein, partial [Sphaerochaetaceae bacterium]
LVRKEARRIANEQKKELLLVDGPPGIGCPVISSITGTSGVVLVTEPSVSGLHDLERVAKLAANFRVPVYVVVNKADIDPEQTKVIEAQVKESNNKFVGTILYDEAMVKAQMLNLSPMEYITAETKRRIEKIWERIW